MHHGVHLSWLQVAAFVVIAMGYAALAFAAGKYEGWKAARGQLRQQARQDGRDRLRLAFGGRK